MKKFILYISLVVLLFSFYGCSQSQTKVPDLISATFKAKFPSAHDIEWHKYAAGTFKTEFKLKSEEISAIFDANGKWLSTETELPLKKLPQIVRTILQTQFSSSNIKEVKRLEKPGDTMFFIVELGKKESELKVIIDSSGNIIKKEVINDEENPADENNQEKKSVLKESKQDEMNPQYELSSQDEENEQGKEND